MAATPESSQQALVAALEGWKQGDGFQELSDRTPSVSVVDDDLYCGLNLLDFRIESEGEPRGIGYTYVVSITVQDKNGAKSPVRKRVAYTVVTEPKHAIIREERKP
jgi:hypothetical protein